MSLKELKRLYELRKREIEDRLLEFKELFDEADDERLFAELVFCLLTPQSKAKVCWRSVEKLIKRNLLLSASYDQLLDILHGVRFKENKARYIMEAREIFMRGGKLQIKDLIRSFHDSREAREWFVENVKGMGYKEASHFLRNIGMGEDLAILDRHILKNLKLLGVIEDVPKSMTRKRYIEIENMIRKFSENIGIPLSHLDLLFWSKETGEIFK